jgi:DNA-binding ferritin-like protein
MDNIDNIDNKELTLNNFIKLCICLQTYTRMFHWTTTSYALHKATDNFVDHLIELMDKFVEVYIGIYKVRPSINQIKISSCSEYVIEENYKTVLATFTNAIRQLNIVDSELLNIRDELLAEMNKTQYLLTFV